jgi:ATP-dependent DNA ligase
MYGSEWSTQENRSGRLYLFDVTELKGSGLTNQSYLERHNALTRLRNERAFPDTWQIIANYPTLQIDSIWSNLVESGKFEGVVFRNPLDLWNVDILRAKLSLTYDHRIIDFEEGKDGNAGSLGAFVTVDSFGVTHSIGGGITKKLRQDVWKNKEYYRGKIIIVEAKKKFASGQLRHPNFVDFHPDKEWL